MADLSTSYLGLKLRTPLVPSASILSIDRGEHQAHGASSAPPQWFCTRCSRNNS